MMVAAPSSAPSSVRESYKGFETNPVEGWESRSEFGNRICDYRGICARLFKDPDYPDRFEGGKHEFVYHLFGLVCGYHNYEPRPLFDDIFTADDMADVWETNNYSSFLYDINNRWLNIPLLKDIIDKADKAICSKGNAADLRFGHDYVIEAFNVLININGSSTIPANADEVKYWMQSYTIPKAANDQFIFYRSGRKNAPVLFKLLLNGREAALPQLEAVSGPYYKWDDFKQYFLSHGEPCGENPSPGNKAGGISTLEEKALGCTQKSGSSPVRGVLAYGDRLQASGLNLLSAPGNDLVASTALAAAGCQLILFTTGRGTPFGTFVPTMKVSTNSTLAANKPTWIDFNAGTIVEGEPMVEVFKRFVQKVRFHLCTFQCVIGMTQTLKIFRQCQ